MIYNKLHYILLLISVIILMSQLINLIKKIMFASKIVRAAVPLCSHQLLWKRSLSLSPSLFNDIKTLEQAKQRVTQLATDPGNDVKLKLYAFYKQVNSMT